LISVGLAAITLQPPVITAKTYGRKNYAEIYGWIGMTPTMGSAICITVIGYAYDYMQKSYVVPFYALSALVALGAVFYLIANRASKRLVWENE